jgi:glycosyltransferase involved in cell wall biosynthesis
MDQNIKPIRLLIFCSYLGGGGAEKHLLRLVNQLPPERFEISVVTPSRSGSYEQALAPHIRLRKVGSRFAFRISKSLARWTCLRPLRKIVQKESPDLLFALTDIHNLIALAAIRPLRHRPKVILGIQNTISQAYARRFNPVHRLILRAIPRYYPLADRLVAISQGVARDMLNLAPVLREKTEVIYNIGMDEQLEDLLKAGGVERPADKPLLLACGRLTYQKGYPYLIRAFAEVLQAREASLWILGEGKMRQQLAEMIRQYQLEDHVHLLGFQPNPYPYMAAADVFVLSSVYEGFGNVLVEAMACETAVVATDCPFGPAEIITAGCGILVPPRDTTALAQGIIQLLDKQTLRQQIARNGKKRAEDFRPSLIAKRYERLFISLLKHEEVPA